METKDDVLQLIDRWSAAELAGDAGAYGTLLSDDFLGVGPVGSVLDATQWAARHQADLHNHEFEVVDPRVRSYGDTAVVDAVQRQVTTARGHDTSGSFRLVAVCRAAADGWRIVHLQLSGPLIAPGEVPSFARPH